MKTNLLVVLALLLVIPAITFATSGTCSYHGGVNCSAGADYDGSAICYDGWRDSTEMYSQMAMCVGSNPHHMCTEQESQSLNIKYGMPDLDARQRDITTRLYDLNQRTISTPSSDTNAQRQLAIDSLQLSSDQATLNSDLNLALSKIDSECYALGDAEYAKAQAEFLQQYTNNQTQQTKTQATPTYTCPSNLLLSGDKCVCSAGNIWDGKMCIAYNQYCQVNYGQFTIGKVENGSLGCYCAEGYTQNATSKQCELAKVSKVQPVTKMVNSPAVQQKVTEIKPVPAVEMTSKSPATTSQETVTQVPKKTTTFWKKLFSPATYIWNKLFGK